MIFRAAKRRDNCPSWVGCTIGPARTRPKSIFIMASSNRDADRKKQGGKPASERPGEPAPREAGGDTTEDSEFEAATVMIPQGTDAQGTGGPEEPGDDQDRVTTQRPVRDRMPEPEGTGDAEGSDEDATNIVEMPDSFESEDEAPFSLAPDPGEDDGETTLAHSAIEGLGRLASGGISYLPGFIAGAVALGLVILFWGSAPMPRARVERGAFGLSTEDGNAGDGSGESAIRLAPPEALRMVQALGREVRARANFGRDAIVVLELARAAEALDLNGDGAWDLVCLLDDGSAVFIDGANGKVGSRVEASPAAADSAVLWALRDEELTLTYSSLDAAAGSHVRVAWPLEAESARHADLIRSQWIEARRRTDAVE